MRELYSEGIWRKKPAVPEPVQPTEFTFVLPLDIQFEDLAVVVSDRLLVALAYAPSNGNLVLHLAATCIQNLLKV